MKSKLIRNLKKDDLIQLGDATRVPYRTIKARVTHVQETANHFGNRRRWRAYFEIVSVNPPGYTSWRSGFQFIEGYSDDRMDVYD